MIVTEKEAPEKRCPLPMGTMNDPRVQNHCIGAGCMAWDWEDDEDEYRSVDHTAESFTAPAIADFKPPEGDGWQAHGAPYQPTYTGRQWRLRFKRPFGERRRGFCGLARRSEVVVTTP